MKKKNISEAYKNLTFAEASKKIDSKFKNKDTDPIEKKSFELEMSILESEQSKAKTIDTMTKALKEFKRGGRLPKYGGGGELDPLQKALLLASQQMGGVNQLGLAQGQKMAQGLIGANTDYMSSQIPVSIPSALSNPLNAITGYEVQNPFSFNVQQPVNTTSSNILSSGIPDTSGLVSGVNSVITGANNLSKGVQTNNGGIKERSGMSAYTPALIGQGLSTLINTGILAGGYDKVNPVENPYESQVKNLMASRRIDTTQQTNSILSAYNAARQNLNGARSINVRNALDANLGNINADNLAESNLNQQVQNNQYSADLASTLNNLGQQKVASRTYSEDATARNKGNFQSNLSALGTNIADSGEFFTNKMTNDNYNKIMGDVLSNKYQNVGLNPEVLQRMKEGKSTPEDISVLKTVYGDKVVSEMFPDFKFNTNGK